MIGGLHRTTVQTKQMSVTKFSGLALSVKALDSHGLSGKLISDQKNTINTSAVNAPEQLIQR